MKRDQGVTPILPPSFLSGFQRGFASLLKYHTLRTACGDRNQYNQPVSRMVLYAMKSRAQLRDWKIYHNTSYCSFCWMSS